MNTGIPVTFRGLLDPCFLRRELFSLPCSSSSSVFASLGYLTDSWWHRSVVRCTLLPSLARSSYQRFSCSPFFVSRFSLPYPIRLWSPVFHSADLFPWDLASRFVFLLRNTWSSCLLLSSWLRIILVLDLLAAVLLMAVRQAVRQISLQRSPDEICILPEFSHYKIL